MNKKQWNDLMKQAQRMQEKVQEGMSELRVEASSGGGAVSVGMDGSKRLLSISIDPEAVDPKDVEMLQDLILAAVNEAGRKVDEALGEQLGGLTSLGPQV